MKKIITSIFTVALITTSAMLASAGDNSSHETKAENVKEVISDSAITTAIKAKFAADSTISAFAVSVKTNHGIVYLSGHVENQAAYDLAIELAKNTKGVNKVVADKLEVTNK